MTNPNAQLQAAIAQFAAQPGITPDQEAQLRAAITQDANLLQHLNQNVANGQLKGFALPQAGAAANLAGTYDMASGVRSCMKANAGGQRDYSPYFRLDS
ncbi:hypothetical protein [Xanthomonas fragariae]|uniref:hypothetical protein n=1 Tax=Xanthomonas fragariae TaxID=48664 RepID=UPI0022AAFAEC|nr:hypothetical protein [Xanthomonas fragariae]WAT15987.1 hypothetical protein OZ429_06615 [Xanthomonas fragariae]